MKIIAIGDTHGSDHWKTVSGSNSFDKFVFLGDYFDSFDVSPEDQIDNFMDIIAFKEANINKVILLVGNHDFHYTAAAIESGERYSGFQDNHQETISELLGSHMQLLQPAFTHDGFLFTHAGVSNSWLQDFGYDELEPVDQFINRLFKVHPGAFMFRGTDPYGDDMTQSPIWIRPPSLLLDAHDKKQVVGHTKVKQIKASEDGIFFIDTQLFSKQCLCINEGIAKIIL